ncbi:helix-turn-helix domain-containing protein [Jiulongibacter sediminis]|uniref:Uncharacterized protein n=1 Tax=Jiulongibacter sediminis TaxID=1605367 RepID=A0A0P7BYX2_9BACT|nr:helix-turn-helix domain-containing protein [Jiulongibacter sediminis]KPM46777.1 hypothetical protein AFM12_18665 [Jiulongibacter sediminis]TBX21681.1 hypothetical protein TK44_18670 [Jiulongibacter sediminis]
MKEIQLLNIELSELKELIQSSVREVLSSTSSEDAGKSKILNQKEACEYLKISPPTFRKIRSRFKAYQVSEGRKVYLKNDLDLFLKENEK